jgi:TldD protein
MTIEKQFNTYFSLDLSGTIKNFQDNSPRKNNIYSELYFEYSNSYILEYVNGIFITDSTTSSSGRSQRHINGRDVQFRAESVTAKSLMEREPQPIDVLTLTNIQRKKILKKAEAKILAKNARIEGLAFKWITKEKFVTIYNNTGFLNYKIESLGSLSLNLKIKKNGVYFDGQSVFSNVEEIKNFTSKKVVGLIESALKDAENKSDCIKTIPSRYDIVFAKGNAGILFHELVGHLLEADYVANGQSIFEGAIGKKIANGQLTLIDGPWNGGPVNYSFDDEGTLSSETILVKNGILKNYISDRYHETNFKIAKTGNGRRQSFHDLPAPRMSNTLVQNGKYDVTEIIESVKKGLYITDVGDGSTNPNTGYFSFTGASGFLIEKGVITKPVNSLEISGNVKDALNNIEMVANDFACAETHADCTKENQIIEVGYGAPTVKIKNLMAR